MLLLNVCVILVTNNFLTFLAEDGNAGGGSSVWYPTVLVPADRFAGWPTSGYGLRHASRCSHASSTSPQVVRL